MNPIIILLVVAGGGYAIYKFMTQEVVEKERKPEGSGEKALAQVDKLLGTAYDLVGTTAKFVVDTVEWVQTDVPEFFGAEGEKTLKVDAKLYNSVFKYKSRHHPGNIRKLFWEFPHELDYNGTLQHINTNGGGQWGTGYQLRQMRAEIERQAAIHGRGELFTYKELGLVSNVLSTLFCTGSEDNFNYCFQKAEAQGKYQTTVVPFAKNIAMRGATRVIFEKSGNENLGKLCIFKRAGSICNPFATRPNTHWNVVTLCPAYTYLDVMWARLNYRTMEIIELQTISLKTCNKKAKLLVADLAMYANIEKIYAGFYLKKKGWGKIWNIHYS